MTFMHQKVQTRQSLRVLIRTALCRRNPIESDFRPNSPREFSLGPPSGRETRLRANSATKTGRNPIESDSRPNSPGEFSFGPPSPGPLVSVSKLWLTTSCQRVREFSGPRQETREDENHLATQYGTFRAQKIQTRQSLRDLMRTALCRRNPIESKQFHRNSSNLETCIFIGKTRAFRIFSGF